MFSVKYSTQDSVRKYYFKFSEDHVPVQTANKQINKISLKNETILIAISQLSTFSLHYYNTFLSSSVW